MNKITFTQIVWKINIHYQNLNGDYFVKYNCFEKDEGTEFEYFELAENGDLDGLMEMFALELLKE